jgi:hypothetical protein
MNACDMCYNYRMGFVAILIGDEYYPVPDCSLNRCSSLGELFNGYKLRLISLMPVIIIIAPRSGYPRLDHSI